MTYTIRLSEYTSQKMNGDRTTSLSPCTSIIIRLENNERDIACRLQTINGYDYFYQHIEYDRNTVFNQAIKYAKQVRKVFDEATIIHEVIEVTKKTVVEKEVITYSEPID